MIHLSKKTRQLPGRDIALPFPPTNILAYLIGQNETLSWDLSMPTTTITYAYDATCCTLSNTTGTTTINHYDTGNSSINTAKTTAIYNYDAICGLHQTESSSNDKTTYADSHVYYYGYRYYCTELGRWVSRDPKAEKLTNEDLMGNIYNAFLNAPVNLIDPEGLVVLSPLTATDKEVKPIKNTGNVVEVYCADETSSPWGFAKLGEITIKVGLDTSDEANIPGLSLPPPGDQNKYVCAHIAFEFNVSDQDALDRCCCKEDASVGWFQFYKGALQGDNMWRIDTGESIIPEIDPSPPPHWYSEGPNMDDSPGRSGATPINRDFRAQLHCRNCSVSGSCQFSSGYKKIGHLTWNTRWTGAYGSNKLKGVLSWDGNFVLPANDSSGGSASQ